MYAIVTVVGKNDVGILSFVSTLLAEQNISVTDIRQTIMREYFTMVMLVDAEKAALPFDQLVSHIESRGAERNLSIHVQREDIFTAMHRI